MNCFINTYYAYTQFIPTDIYPVQYGEEQCNRNHSFGPCVRSNYLLHYVYSGKGIFQTENNRLQRGGIERLISFLWNVGRETLCARYFSILALQRRKPSLLEMASMISRCWKQSAPVWPWGMRRMRSKPTPPARADRWKKTESTIFA